MDPLSITASTITLIHAAGAITTSLRRVSDAFRTAESRLAALCDQLSNLTAFLEAVERSLKGCSSLDLATVDEGLWHQTEVVMADCQTTLNELSQLVDNIREATCAKGFGWKTRVVIDLSVRGAEIAALRDKINKSTSALRTILHTINVSISLRNNASHEVILFELDQLKLSITDAIRTSLQPAQGFGGPPDSRLRIGHNLRNLAEAASQFHSVASSTASTIGNSSRAATLPRTYSDVPMSPVGAFPSFKRAWVETYLSDAQRLQGRTANPDTLPRTSSPYAITVAPAVRPISVASFLRPVITWPSDATSDYEDEDELELERMFLEGLEDLARDSIRSGDFNQAIAFLSQAINRKGPKGPDGSGPCRLDVELALCYLFQGDQRQAEPAVLALSTSPCPDLVVCTMLHAISLAHLKSYSFDRALELCKQALHGKKRWFKSMGMPWKNSPEYAESLGLLATIFDMMGDYISAEIYRRRLPCGYVYKHPVNRFEFIANHVNLLQDVLGADLPVFCHLQSLGDVNWECMLQLDLTTRGSTYVQGGEVTCGAPGVNDMVTSPLRTKRYQWERYESDTSKEVVVPDTDSAIGMDDGESTGSPMTPLSPVSPFKRRLSRMFGSKRATGTRSRVPPETIVNREPKQLSPITRWFKGNRAFGLKRSRSLKRCDEDPLLSHLRDSNSPKTFKLLHMRRMTLEDLHSPSYRPGPGGYSESQTADHEKPENASATSPISRGFPTNIGEHLPDAGGLEHGTLGDDSASFTAGDTPSEYYSSCRPHLPTDNIVATTEVPGDSAEPARYHQRGIPPDMPGNDPSAQSSNRRYQVHDRNQRFIATAPECDNLATLLASLARILALLPTLESAEYRRVVRVKLKSLAARLKLVTRDMQVVYDVQSVVTRLEHEERRKVRKKSTSTSERAEEKPVPPSPREYDVGLRSSSRTAVSSAGRSESISSDLKEYRITGSLDRLASHNARHIFMVGKLKGLLSVANEAGMRNTTVESMWNVVAV